YPPAAVTALAALAAGDAIAREQHLDFLTMRGFRLSLLCRAGAAGAPMPLRDVHLSSAATRGAAAGTYHTRSGVTARLTAPATIAAVDALIDAWPASLPFAELPDTLLELFVAGVVEVSLRPAALVALASAAPMAAPYARWQAARGVPVTT